MNRPTRHLAGILLLALVPILAVPSAAQNLLINPGFDLDPDIIANGWDSIGTGLLVWDQVRGIPVPGARSDVFDAETLMTIQCVSIVGGTSYDFDVYSYTLSASGTAAHSESYSTFSSVDCSGSPLETVDSVLLGTEPGSWYHWGGTGLVAPPTAQSARIELYAEANGTQMQIVWDNARIAPTVAAASVPASSQLALILLALGLAAAGTYSLTRLRTE